MSACTATALETGKELEEIADVVFNHLGTHGDSYIRAISCDLLLLDTEQVRRALELLESRGLVERKPDPNKLNWLPDQKWLYQWWGLSAIHWSDVRKFFRKVKDGCLEWLRP